MSTTAASILKSESREVVHDAPQSVNEPTLVPVPVPVPALRTPKRRRDASPVSDGASTSPGTPDSLMREIAARRVGDRSLTPYPPPPFSPRVISGKRCLTPYPRRRASREATSGTETPLTSRSSSPDKENVPLVPSLTPSPSPKKKGKFHAEARGRALGRTGSVSSLDSVFTFGVPTNSPRSLSPESAVNDPETPPKADELACRLFEAEITRKCKELTESPLADITEAFKERDVFDACDFGDLLCPPNSPVTAEVTHDWYVDKPL